MMVMIVILSLSTGDSARAVKYPILLPSSDIIICKAWQWVFLSQSECPDKIETNIFSSNGLTLRNALRIVHFLNKLVYWTIV